MLSEPQKDNLQNQKTTKWMTQMSVIYIQNIKSELMRNPICSVYGDPFITSFLTEQQTSLFLYASCFCTPFQMLLETLLIILIGQVTDNVTKNLTTQINTET